MKIMHVHLSEEFAGSERYAASLAAEQVKGGHAVAVVVRQSRVTERWRKEVGKADVITLPWWVPAFAETWVIRKYIQGFMPEVVHTHLGRANVKAGREARHAGVPWVATMHLRWKGKEMMGSNGVVCIAAWQKQEIPTDYKGFVRVVWNWLPAMGRGGDGFGLRKRWGATAQTVVFGSVGRLHGQKGMDVLVRAFRQAFDGGEDVRLVLVGEGRQKKELVRLAAGDSRIIFAGYAEDVSGFYAGFDVYVSAARYEPFGLTVLEAMAAGNVLVCTKSEGPSEYLKGEEVRWVEKGQVAGLAAGLQEVYQGGRRRVKYDMQPFTAGRGCAEIVAFYEKVRSAC